MEILNATDAKRDFGEVLLKVQKEPVLINKNGKPVAVVVSSSDYEYFEELHSKRLKAEIKKGMDDISSGRMVDGKAIMASLRKRVKDAKI